MSKQTLSPRLIQDKYSSIIASEVRNLVQQATNRPDQLIEAIRRYVGPLGSNLTPELMLRNLAAEVKS